MSSNTNLWKCSSGVWMETAPLVTSRPEKSVLGLMKSDINNFNANESYYVIYFTEVTQYCLASLICSLLNTLKRIYKPPDLLPSHITEHSHLSLNSAPCMQTPHISEHLHMSLNNYPPKYSKNSVCLCQSPDKKQLTIFY